MLKGRVFDIQRFSIHDGPGIRTTVFFKGCPLTCLWCGNPESIPAEPSLSYTQDQCIGCQACVPVCPEKALSPNASGVAALDREQCTECGKCAPVCDPKALEVVGRDLSAAEVLEVVQRDQQYYRASDGGMTLSGGEPLMQPRFAEELLRRAKTLNLHCCVETSGYALWGAIRPLAQLVDLWLFDFKETDPRRHRQFVAKSNELILSNLQRLHDEGAQILLRCPMIPHHNARQEHLDGIVALARKLPRIKGVELLPYYDLWRAKLGRFGLTSQLPESVKPPDQDTIQSWEDYLRARDVPLVS